VLVLTRGEPTSIVVVNRSGAPTAVHWHGIELDSYFDGVVGWGGVPGRTTPAIRPGRSFEVRVTPPRAGSRYRFRFANLAVFRPGLVVRLVRDSSLLSWLPLAKDGWTLAGPQAALRTGAQRVATGETADFAFLPDRPGVLTLELRAGNTGALLGSQRLLASPAPP
jgi:hypothetical protein